jgi:hypothetical protein
MSKQIVEAHRAERFTDGREVVSIMRRPLLTPKEDSWYYSE